MRHCGRKHVCQHYTNGSVKTWYVKWSTTQTSQHPNHRTKKGMLVSLEFDFLKVPVTSYRDATAFVNRSESQRVTAIYAQTIKFANTVHTQSPHSVPTASTRRSHSFLTTFKTLMARTQRV